MEIELYRDLEAYHGWAMGKVLDRCRILERSALTTEMPLGPGSLLATLQHMATAERVWLARWRHQPFTGIPSSPDSLERLESLFAACAAERAGWFESDPDIFSTKIQYKDLTGGSNEQRLGDLVVHVFNHAVHHRAQVVHFLKRYGQTFPGGVDYIFFRIAKPTILLRAEVAAGCRQWGLEVCPLRQVVSVDVGGGPMEFRLSESLIQLSVHGTLHRAQITNMIRACGKIPAALDFVVWLRQSTPSNETNN